jgi:hypothetical protein
MPRYCGPNLHRTASVFHSWDQGLSIIGLLGGSAWCWEQREGQLTWSCYAFPLFRHLGFIIITPSFLPFSVVLSNRGLTIATPPWMSDLWSSGLFLWKQSLQMNIEFCCHLCCSNSAIFRHNPLHCTAIPSLSFGFRPQTFHLMMSLHDLCMPSLPWEMMLWIHLMQWPFWYRSSS